MILTQIGRFRTVSRSQLSNSSDLPCFYSIGFQKVRYVGQIELISTSKVDISHPSMAFSMTVNDMATFCNCIHTI